jgi:hypothetical protein
MSRNVTNKYISSPFWERIGSKVAIFSLHKMEIVYVYQKKRKEFGKQAMLAEKAAEVSLSIAPDPAYIKNYVERNPSNTEAQACPDKSEHEVS